MGIVRKGHVSHLLIKCVPISVLASKIGSLLTLLKDNFQALYTKVSKFYLILRPLSVALVVVVVMMEVSMEKIYLP